MDSSPLESDQEMYVEELAGPDDYWLSLTDAARVCRVQDVSIRRAIKRKVLPVRRQRAGQNKRTRLVRASDLAQAGFPIIDTSAAITTEVGKVDVLSIPRQQQQIMHEHQEFLTQLHELREISDNHHKRMRVEVQQMQEHLRASLQAAQEEQTRRVAAVEMRLAREQEQRRHELTEASLHLRREQQALREELTRGQQEALVRDERTQTAIDALSHALSQEQAETLSRDEHTRTKIAVLYQKLERNRAEALTHERDTQAALSTLEAAHLEHQQETQRQIDALVATQQQALIDHQHRVDLTLQNIEQELQTRLRTLEQRVSESLQQTAQACEAPLHDLRQAIKALDTQLADQATVLTQTRQSTERLLQNRATRDQEFTHILQRQQVQINQHERLLPLLPYLQRGLATQQDIAVCLHSIADLEDRLLTLQQPNTRSLLPLLDLLSPQRLEILLRLIEREETPPPRSPA
jgi:hypothetical protein